ncbi:hypothetical protein [Brevibacterium oceani]|uniref:hypothetical protein n=1 Tax=Brevibacterium oceani TaxID=358099 RepID=UPI0015E79664|nr:hypothetical protein [Brevibacterium oceani]
MTDTVKAWIEERRAIQASGVPFSDRDSRANFPRALTAIEAVLGVHRPDQNGECGECTVIHHGNWHVYHLEYPCPTVRVIEGAINHD